MIDLSDYQGYKFIDIQRLSFNQKGLDLRNTLSLINNSLYQEGFFDFIKKFLTDFYFPDLVITNITYPNNILTLEIIPILPNGKTYKNLFLYTVEMLNHANFPYYLELKNSTASNTKIIIKKIGYTRKIDGINYSKKDFNNKIMSLQKSFGTNNNWFSNGITTLSVHIANLTRFRLELVAQIKYYLPKNVFKTDLKHPEGTTDQSQNFNNLLSFLNNPLKSIKKPLLYAGGAFLVYTVVKEAAKKHL